MGGKLVTHYGFSEKRIAKEEYLKLVEKVKNVFDSKLVPPRRHQAIPHIRNKISFGDLDYLVENFGDINYYYFLKDNFNSSFIHHNAGVYSIEDSGFQIDIILTEPSYYDFSLMYLSNNDISNLVGRCFHKMGMSLGHRGLSYRVRESLFSGIEKQKDNQIDEIILTYNPYEAWGMLEYDLKKFKEGFNTLEDAFKWVIDNKYFNSEIFAFPNLNHTNRVRNKKRENYCKFLKYLEGKTFKDYPYEEDKTKYLPFISEHFPNFPIELEKSKLKYFHNKELQSKFNGNLVMEWLNLTVGEELGMIIGSFKKKFGSKSEDFGKFLEINSPEEIKKGFLTWYNFEYKLKK